MGLRGTSFQRLDNNNEIRRLRRQITVPYDDKQLNLLVRFLKTDCYAAALTAPARRSDKLREEQDDRML